MSFESYNKKKALALWDELFSDFPSFTIKEAERSDGPVLRVYNPNLNKNSFSAHAYYGRSRWRDFYRDLLKYQADKTPWDNIRPAGE